MTNPRKDLTGQQFGKLVALEAIPAEKGKPTKWLCRCECGNVKAVRTSDLLSGNTKTCGCSKAEAALKAAEKNRGKPSKRVIDLTGRRFGRLLVIERSEKRAINGSPMWVCKCDCGNIVEKRGDALRYGRTASCGCLAKELSSERMKTLQAKSAPSQRLIDLIGQRFERLTVIERVPNSATGQARWRCLCDCGKETVTTTAHLRSGHTKSCGCLGLENATKAKIKHGNTHESLYNTWAAMKRRCDNPNVDTYKYYGGKGVKLCDDWHEDYGKFKEWALSHGYEPGLTIDRINSDGNYEPSNCQWITAAENIRRAHKKKE